MLIIHKNTIHLVFSRRIPTLEAEILEAYQITGFTTSLDDTLAWASSQENVPDAILINGFDHYRQNWKPKQKPNKILMNQLKELKLSLPTSRLKILLPEEKNLDQDLLIDLMQEGFYDFWFLEVLTSKRLKEILFSNREFEDLEQYLATLPVPDIGATIEAAVDRQAQGFGSLIQNLIKLDPQKIKADIMDKLWPPMEASPFIETSLDQADDVKCTTFQPSAAIKNKVNLSKNQEDKPYQASEDEQVNLLEEPLQVADRSPAICSGTAFFWSDDDGLLPYAVSFLLAYYLAKAGFKTALMEVPGLKPRLGAALGIRHPIWNLRSALRQFAAGQETFYQQCIFNSSLFLHSHLAYDQNSFIKKFPEQLYFLPDASEEDGTKEAMLYPHWEKFLISWIQWAMYSQKFQFIFYCGYGTSNFQETVLKQMSYYKIIALHPWANGFNQAQQMSARWPEQTIFLWSRDAPNYNKEVKAISGTRSFLIPDAVYQDYLGISAFRQSPDHLQPETVGFLTGLAQLFLPGMTSPRQGKGIKAWFTADQ